MLGALAATLGCLPHCRRGASSPQLHLCLRVALAPGSTLPALEAFRLQHLLADLGLLPHGIECVQVRALARCDTGESQQALLARNMVLPPMHGDSVHMHA